jgi:hypothetical protein
MLPPPVTSPAAEALIQKNNELTAVYFAAAILALIAIFSFIRVVGLVPQIQTNKRGPSAKTALYSARYVESSIFA